MKKHSNKFIHYLILALIYGVGIATIFTHTALHALENKASVPSPKTSCADGTTIRVDVHDNAFKPDDISAKRCDTLIITNNNNTTLLIALGSHDSHIGYPGLIEKPIKSGEELRVRLTETGHYIIHDHLHEEIEGELTIE